jgi:hypothetical protein
MEHSWYAIMGGSVFETHDPDKPEFIPGSPTLVLTSLGVVNLSREGRLVLPEINAKQIKNYSKADTLAKGLVIVQAGYLGIQCIARLADKLPISPLEINNVGHVLCALMMYYFWFSKLKGVRVTTPIREVWALPACAFLYMCSRLSCLPKTGGPEFKNLSYYPNLETDYTLYDPNATGWKREARYRHSTNPAQPARDPDESAEGVTTGSPGQTVGSVNSQVEPAVRSTVLEREKRSEWYIRPVPGLQTSQDPSLTFIPSETDATGNPTAISIKRGQTLGNTRIGPQRMKRIRLCAEDDSTDPSKLNSAGYPLLEEGTDNFWGPNVYQLDKTAATRWDLTSLFLEHYDQACDDGPSLYTNPRAVLKHFHVGNQLVLRQSRDWPHESGMFTADAISGTSLTVIALATMPMEGFMRLRGLAISHPPPNDFYGGSPHLY